MKDDSWISSYFRSVPALLAEYGARQISGAMKIKKIEGQFPLPDRVAIFSFPSVQDAENFMADVRYQPFREARCKGSASEILLFENEAQVDGFV